MRKNHRDAQKTLGKLIIFFMSSILIGLLVTGMLVTTFKQTKSVYLHNFLSEFSMNGYMYAFGAENHYFTQEYRTLNKEYAISSLLLAAATNIRLHDVRSLLGTELPGFTKYDTEILIAGEGTNYSNLPIESNVPLEDMIQERKGQSVQKTDGPRKPPLKTTGEKKVVFIYHTHSWESYLPLLNLPITSADNKATSSVSNISLFGDRLREQLSNYGIGATNDKTDIGKLLISKGLNSNSSYKASRQIVQEAMTGNKELQYFFDLHRDSARKTVTTKEINGKSYAKMYFIIGAGNKGAATNEKLATELHEMIEKKYPGLSRGVGRKDFSMGNGIYNQDLSGQAILIEIGGIDNDVEELNRTIDVLAETFSEYYWQATKVNHNE